MNKIVVRHERQWGNNRFYPVNELAFKLLEFTSYTEKSLRSTFTETQIKIAKELGFEIEVKTLKWEEVK